MTKRIYKTAKELRIRESEKKALLKFAKFIRGLEPDERVKIPGDGMFRFEMAAVSEPDYNTDKYQELTDGGFDSDDKDIKMLHRECGTAGCIWGGAHLLAINGPKKKSPFGKSKIFPDGNYSDRLHDLFYPTNVRMSDVTPYIAAKTTLHYLKTGKIDFQKYMD